MRLKVLYIEDNPLDVEFVDELLRENGFDCEMTVVEMEASLRDSLEKSQYDLILSDCSLPAYNGIAALSVARLLCPEIPFIFVSGTLGEEAAIECLKCGATDYVLKERLSRLPPVVRRALDEVEARKRHEATLRELDASREAFYQAQKLETVGRLAGGIAHDFNNLLAVILGYAEVIQASTSNGDVRGEYSREIIKASHRAADLVEQLLSYSRNQRLDPVVINLNDELSHIHTMLSRLVGEQVRIEAELADDLWLVEIDPVRFDQIIMNLGANARDAMPDGGMLSIKTRNLPRDHPEALLPTDLPPGDYVEIRVTDNGTGMSSEVLEKVFEPFFTTKEVGKGSGLGLASSYGIVKQSRGGISVQSEVGVGTAFSLFLPRSRGELQPQLAADTHPAAVHGVPHEVILLADDDENVLRLMELVLDDAGYEVKCALTMAEAVELAEKSELAEKAPITLLVTDVVLPDGNGKELASRIAESHPHISVIYTSGYGDSITQGLGISPAADRVVRKPVRIKELLDVVRSTLDRTTR